MNGIIITITLALVGVLGDFFIKLSTSSSKPTASAYFWIGAAIYGATAFGWFYAMKFMKLGTLGAFYSLTTVLALVMLGVLYFKENLSLPEGLGIVLAILSIILLSRFS